ncbi:uncharacterized protein A4U43_C04F26300 [Asparagus officinalis]|uniref:Uncharacterized protein n=1 Tax=Asparagus officinalis TaxID=4686 RepID=A0A5P1F5I9_ASPOF|nr:uncharacterized protein A4U43_C04F26300 [Asparagus officinalis]
MKLRHHSEPPKIPIQKIEIKGVAPSPPSPSARLRALQESGRESPPLRGPRSPSITSLLATSPTPLQALVRSTSLEPFLSRFDLRRRPSLSRLLAKASQVVDAEAVALLQRYNGLKEEKYWRTANHASSSTSGDDNNRKKYWWEEEKVELMDLEELLCFRERLMEFRKLVADPASDCVQGA